MTSAILLATSLLAAPCNLPATPGTEPLDPAVTCAWVTVPLRHDDPSRGTIRLWTARLPATGRAADDPVAYLHGGPGIATVDSLLPWLPMIRSFAMFREHRDVILFDQRGTGRSEQALCPELGGKLDALSGENLEPEVEDARGRALFAECRATLDAAGIDLAAYTTAQTAADLDAVRRAYGVERWNLSSVSYGTLVALHAMRTYPGTIRSAILDSPFPPNSVSWAEQASTASAAYHAIERACAAQPACRERFGALVPKLESTFARLDAEPLPDGDKVINGRRFASALWPLAVRSSTVKYVPMAIDAAHRGDESVIRGLVRTYASGNSFGAMSIAQGMAVMCHEGGRTRDWFHRAKTLYPALVSDAPVDSWDRNCADYRPGFASPDFFAPVASDIPTLVFAGVLDPATPTVDAYQTIRFLPNATLVELQGVAHAPMGLDDCTLGIARAFLARPGLDAAELSCVAERPAISFAEDGLSDLFAPEGDG